MMTGGQFPLYRFGNRSTSEQQPSAEVGEGSMLNSLILSKWEDCLQKDLFRYDVTACETRVLPGSNGFVAQLNEGRQTKKRPTEFRVDRVLQPFDSNKFNFTKVAKEEVLFRFEESETGVSEYWENAPLDSSSSPSVVVINVSPIEYGHVLLVPRVMDQIPQRIDPDTLLLALHMIAEVRNPYFRVGYNSLGAFATINQLHFQAYYLNVPFPLERAATRIVVGPRFEGDVKVSEVVNYPVRCLVFEIGSSFEELADEVAKVCMRLQDANQPYNVLITDGGARVFVIPQCFSERQAKGEVEQAILDIRVNPAVWEISGHMILFRREDYEQADEERAWKLLAEVSLSEERFDAVKKMCLTPSNGNTTAMAVTDAVEGDSGMAGYLNMALHKAKVRKTMGLKTLRPESIVPLA